MSDDDDEREVATLFSRVSGYTLANCYALAGRYDAERGYRPPDVETWVVRLHDDEITTLYSRHGWLTGIWASEAGRVYVSDIERQVHHYDQGRNEWDVHEVDANVMGIWGLADDQVFAWGLAENATPVALHWDGEAWRRIGTLPQITWNMHGRRGDRVYAVGDRGMIACWDGARWTAIDSPVRGTLTGVHVAPGGETVYACGPELLRGTAGSFERIARAGASQVAWWRDELWVATTDQGLCVLRDGNLVSRAPPSALDLDARGNLLMATHEHILATADGKGLDGVGVEGFAALVAVSPPMWR